MARRTLNRAAIIEAAVRIADAEGLAALTMRRLGTELGVEAMSLYNHVANKEDLHRALVNDVWAQVELAGSEPDWRAGLHRLCGSAYRAMVSHDWFFQLPVTYGGEARMAVINGTLAHLERGGVGAELGFHALHVLDGFVYGYAWQHAGFKDLDSLMAGAGEALAAIDAGALPHVIAHAQQHLAGGPPGDGFTVGLDLILDGLERVGA